MSPILDSGILSGENFAMDFNRNSFLIEKSPERLNRSIISICTNGYAEVEVDFVAYRIEKGTILTAFPTQIIHQEYASDNFTIVYVACSPEMLNKVLFRFPSEFELFLKENPIHNLPEELYQNIINFLRLVKTKYEKTDNLYRSEIVVSMLRIQYLDILNDIQHILSKNQTKHTRKVEIMKLFINLIIKHHKENRKVLFYADKLNITPKYLSIVTQEERGMGAKKIIDDFMITEIKLRLKSTSQTIQKISDELNFPDQSFFSKYFKQHTGLTPKDYRNTSS